jgi:hypothetical protein
MAILNRITLKNFFRKGSVPTETNFADLIDSSINIVEDGIGRSIDDGFRIAPMGYSKKLLSFYENSQKIKPDWFIKSYLKTGSKRLYWDGCQKRYFQNWTSTRRC